MGKSVKGTTSCPFRKILDFIFQSSFRFTAKLRGRSKDFPYLLYLHTQSSAFPIINIPQVRGTFITADKPTLTHHCHPESINYIGAHLVPIQSICLNKFMMICIYHYTIIHSGFIAPKFICTLPIHPYLPSPTSGNLEPFCYLQSFSSSRMSYSWNHIVDSLFRLVSFTL